MSSYAVESDWSDVAVAVYVVDEPEASTKQLAQHAAIQTPDMIMQKQYIIRGRAIYWRMSKTENFLPGWLYAVMQIPAIRLLFHDTMDSNDRIEFSFQVAKNLHAKYKFKVIMNYNELVIYRSCK